jgi:serine protease Do
MSVTSRTVLTLGLLALVAAALVGADGSKLSAAVTRGDETKTLTLTLADGWRKSGDNTWRPAMSPLRMWLAGFRSQSLTAQQRKDAGLAEDVPALRLEFMAPEAIKERNPSPAKLGTKVGDVLIEVDGQKEFLQNEGWLLAYLVQKKKPGDTVKLTVLRGGQRKEFEVTLP